MKSQLLDTPMDIDLSQTTTASATDSFQELYETLNIMSGGVEILSNDGQRLNNEELQCQIKLQT